MKNSRFPALLLAISLITTSLPAAFAAVFPRRLLLFFGL